MDEGILYVFTLKERLLSARLHLERLKREGYIETYGEGAVFADYPRLNIAGVVAKRGEGTIWNWGYTLPGEDKSEALRTAAYEAMERSASYYVPDPARPTGHPFVVGDARHLFPHIPISRTPWPVDSPLVKNEEDLQEVSSLTVRPLTGGRARSIPAHCLYWGSWFSQSPNLIQEPTTSGSGGGATREAALLSALLELIERDTFLLHWYGGVPPPEIVLDPSTHFSQMISREEERYNLRIRFFSTTYDVPVPVCVCLITDPVLNIVAFGAKAHATAGEALRGAGGAV
jgi:thiazole/oxazole-forming peptide maturase SagD family component